MASAPLDISAGVATPIPGTAGAGSTKYRFTNVSTDARKGSNVHVNATGSTSASDDLKEIVPGGSNDLTATGALYAWSTNATKLQVDSAVDTSTGNPSPGTGGSGGGGTSSTLFSLAIPTQGDVTFRRMATTRTLAGLKAVGKVGTCQVSYVTAAQYAASGEAATGTVLGTLSVASDNTPSSTIAASQALTAGDWLRFDPANPNGPLHVYEA